MQQPPQQNAVFSVSQLNQRARQLLEISFSNVRVEGEISSLSRPSSGHWYFSLKDSQSQVRCAMFRSRAAMLKFLPKEGDKVEIRAKVSLYEARGDYQLIVESMKPAGEGALLLAFQQLKARLQSEGLFAPEMKQPVPKSRRVGVITSATGAALHDILTVLKRRNPAVEVDVYPALVQGAEAVSQLIAALQRANRDQLVDVIILGRGGGSMEDLWCFNDERLAREIFASRLPVISAVGHEVDFTISDFVADLRAPTPSAAAELVSDDQQQYWQHIQGLQQRLQQAQQAQLQRCTVQLQHLRQRLRGPAQQLQQQALHLDRLEQRLLRACQGQLQQSRLKVQHLSQRLRVPADQLQQQSKHVGQLQQRLMRAWSTSQQQRQWQLNRQQQRLLAQHPGQRLQASQSSTQQLFDRLQHAMQHQLEMRQQALAHQAGMLQNLSPLNVLGRGYSLTRAADNRVIHTTSDVSIGEFVTTQLAEGRIESQVTAVHHKATDSQD